MTIEQIRAVIERRALAIEVDANKSMDRLTVVNGILNALLGKAKTLLGNVHPTSAAGAPSRSPDDQNH